MRLNYGHHELGLNQELLRIFLQDKVKLSTASDAHRPADVGKYIEESYQTLGWAHQEAQKQRKTKSHSGAKALNTDYVEHLAGPDRGAGPAAQ